MTTDTDTTAASTVDIKPRSRVVTDGLEATASRGMLRAVGMGDDDWVKPQIGVASSWNEITPCNLSLDRLAKAVKDGVHAAGGYPLEFGTISVSDGISMGHEGMHYSLVSREIIADSVETVMSAERLDGSVLLAGCDKSLPGMLMAAARLDLASVFLYAGSIMPGRVGDKDVTIIDAFEAVGACLKGLITREQVTEIERAICPGEGACGGMYTANTMASAAEALGMSLPGSAAPPAVDRRRDGFARKSGMAVVEMLRQGITARQILTKEAFENAIAVTMAFGGSTNAVLHLLAIANEAEVDLTLDDFVRVGKNVPHLGDLKPFGRYVMNDVDRVGGVPVVMRGTARRRADERRLPDRDRQDDGREPGRHRAAGHRRHHRPGAEQPHPPHRRHHHPARVAGPGGCGGQERRLRHRGLAGHGPGLRWRAGSHERAGGRHRRRRRRGGHPLRGAEGWSRDAGDAGHHRRDQGRRSGQGRHADHRRTLLRRHHRALRRTHRPGGHRRRPDRPGRGRRRDYAGRGRRIVGARASTRPSWLGAARPGRPRLVRRPAACWASTSSWSSRPTWARSAARAWPAASTSTSAGRGWPFVIGCFPAG